MAEKNLFWIMKFSQQLSIKSFDVIELHGLILQTFLILKDLEGMEAES
jgi:hypothetical protein